MPDINSVIYNNPRKPINHYSYFTANDSREKLKSTEVGDDPRQLISTVQFIIFYLGEETMVGGGLYGARNPIRIGHSKVNKHLNRYALSPGQHSPYFKIHSNRRGPKP